MRATRIVGGFSHPVDAVVVRHLQVTNYNGSDSPILFAEPANSRPTRQFYRSRPSRTMALAGETPAGQVHVRQQR